MKNYKATEMTHLKYFTIEMENDNFLQQMEYDIGLCLCRWWRVLLNIIKLEQVFNVELHFKKIMETNRVSCKIQYPRSVVCVAMGKTKREK